MSIYKKFLQKVLFKKCLYLGKSSYLISPGGEAVAVDKDFSDRVFMVILARERYFETVKSFSFANLKEIKGAIEMDRSAYSPLVAGRFFIRKLGGGGDEGARVNLWFVDEDTTGRLQRLAPLLVVPETAFLAFGERGRRRIYTVDQDGEAGFFAFIDRDNGVRSLLSRNSRDDFKHFIRVIGAAAHDCPVTEIERGKKPFSFFPAAVDALALKDLWPFLEVASRSWKIQTQKTKIGLAAAAVIMGTYLLLSGGYPALIHNRLTRENQALAGSLAEVLAKQKSIDDYRAAGKKLAAPLNHYPYKLPLLNLLNRVLPAETTISRLKIAGNTVEMQGVTPQASKLLDVLARKSGVKNARFTAPLRADKKTGGEYFRLMFVYGVV